MVNYAAGTSPDVFLTWAQYKPQFVEDGIILDVSNYIKRSQKFDLDKFYPVIEDNLSYQGKLWGAPWGFNSTLWIANVDLLNERGLPVPGVDWTASDFRDYARKVAQPEKQIFAIRSAPIASGGGHAIQWLKNWTGHGWVDEAQRNVLVDTEKSVEMLDYWRELDRDLEVMPSADHPRQENGSFLVTGDVAFEQTWTTITSNMARIYEQDGEVPVNWAFVTYPAGPEGQSHFAQGHLWTIPANHPNPDDAWKLLEWLGSEAADEVWSSSQRTPPTMPNRDHWASYIGGLPAKDQEKALDFIVNVLYNGNYAQNFEYWPTYGEMNSIMRTQMGKVFSGDVPAKTAMEEANRQMQSILDDYWKEAKK